MRYPHAPSTLARPDHGDYIEIVFAPAPKRGAAATVTATKARGAHSAAAGRTIPAPVVVSGDLSAAQWERLIVRIAALPAPVVASKPSASAIPDSTSSAVPRTSSTVPRTSSTVPQAAKSGSPGKG